ncbi:MAG: cyclase family protein [Gemmatimonadota bacterium]
MISTRVPATLLLLLPLACSPAPAPSAPGAAAVFAGASGRWVDLTHPFSEDAIYWPTARAFELDTVSFGDTPGGWFYSAFDFRAAEHGGTHLDAPIHFAEGRQAADEIPLDRLIGAAAVVDISARADADAQVEVADLEAWEAEHGPLPPRVILLLRTGWSSRYDDRVAYLGTDVTGPEAVPLLHFPGLHPDAARWLVEQRDVAAVGIDTPSIDYGQSQGFESHRILYDADIPGFENVAGLEQLPAQGAFVVALPMKIAGGSGGPLRIVAFVPQRT